MTSPDDDRIEAIADEIERYVNARPDSADTVEGIGKWWIEHTRLEESLDLIGKAIEKLVGNGTLKKIGNSDGTVVYSINRECNK
jgi:hypothetical protein